MKTKVEHSSLISITKSLRQNVALNQFTRKIKMHKTIEDMAV